MYFLTLLLALLQQPEPLNQIHVHKPLEILKMPDKVVLLEEQGGIAGKHFWKWSVEPSGEWKFECYMIDSKGKERDYVMATKGKISNIKTSSIARALEENKYETLPKILGKKTINNHAYTLTVGKKSFVLQGIAFRHPGQTISDNIIRMVVGTEDIDRAQHVREYIRFAIIAQTIDLATEPQKKIKHIVWSEKHKDETIRMNIGDKLYIQMTGAGCSRFTLENSAKIKDYLKQEKHTTAGDFDGKPEGTQTHTFQFVAIKAGNVKLDFSYVEPFGKPQAGFQEKNHIFTLEIK